MPWDKPLQLKVLRNADFKEVSLQHGGRAVLRFALAYGFRNIQTIVSASPAAFVVPCIAFMKIMAYARMSVHSPEHACHLDCSAIT